VRRGQARARDGRPAPVPENEAVLQDFVRQFGCSKENSQPILSPEIVSSLDFRTIIKTESP